MPKKFAYCRVSARYSADSGLSVQAQIDEIMSAAWHEGEWFEESCGLTSKNLPSPTGFAIDNAVSAWKVPFASRPGGKWICERVKPGDHIYFYSIDRGFRSLVDFSKLLPHWIEMGVNVHFVTEQFSLDTANGRLLANVIAAFAQWKSEMQSERAKEIAYMRKCRGKAPKKEKFEWEPGAKVYDDKSSSVPEPKSGRVFPYLRVSHVYSAQSGLSIEAQKKSTSDFTDSLLKKRPELSYGGRFIDEAVSAYSHDLRSRPSGKALNDTLQSGDHVVFHKPDRAFRSMKDMVLTVEDWMNRGITMHFVDTRLDSSSHSGKMFLRMLCMMAEWESDMISQRTKAALNVARKEGRKLGGVIPNGCNVAKRENKKRLYVDRELVKWMRYIVLLRDVYKQSWERISDIIEERQSKLEGRPYIYPGGTDHKVKTKHRHGKSIKMDNVTHRPYSRRRCQREYAAWPRIRKLLRKGVKRAPVLCTS